MDVALRYSFWKIVAAKKHKEPRLLDVLYVHRFMRRIGAQAKQVGEVPPSIWPVSPIKIDCVPCGVSLWKER